MRATMSQDHPHNDLDSLEACNLADWVRQSGSPLTLLQGASADIPNGSYVLDEAERDRLFQGAFAKHVGSYPIHRASELTTRVAKRVVTRLVKSHADKSELDAKGLATASFYPMQAELLTMVPVRHLVRNLAATLTERIVILPISQSDFTVVQGWAQNALEPIFFVLELHRRGIAAALWLENSDHSKPISALTFRLSKSWLPKQRPSFWHSKDFSHLLCKTAMRKPKVAMEMHDIRQCRRKGVFSSRNIPIKAQIPWPSATSVSLTQGPRFGDVATYNVTQDGPNLGAAFCQMMGRVAESYSTWLQKELGGKKVKTVHIADHATLEGGLLAYEAAKRGGAIHIWPHSSNAVQPMLHEPINVSGITMAVKTTADIWAKRFGKSKLKVDPLTILPELRPAPDFDDSFPLYVVLFSGAFALQRMPFVDYAKHDATWRNVLKTLQSSDLKFAVKARPTWETEAWIKARAHDPATLAFEATHATKLSSPNMLFASISLTSTALIEGIARGIPGFVVQDTKVGDTHFIDAGGFPCLRSEDVPGFVAEMKDTKAWTALRDQQRDWYVAQTAPYSQS